MTTEMIWKQFSKRLLLFIDSKIKNEIDAEDLFQEVFLKIHNNLEKLKNLKKIESWIYQITRNVINDYYRKYKLFDELPENLSVPTAEEQDFRKDIAICLIGLLGQLPEIYKQPLKASYLEGKTQKKIAEEIGLSLPGVKSRVQRGRSMLTGILKECCNIESTNQSFDCNYEC